MGRSCVSLINSFIMATTCSWVITSWNTNTNIKAASLCFSWLDSWDTWWIWHVCYMFILMCVRNKWRVWSSRAGWRERYWMSGCAVWTSCPGRCQVVPARLHWTHRKQTSQHLSKNRHKHSEFIRRLHIICSELFTNQQKKVQVWFQKSENININISNRWF